MRGKSILARTGAAVLGASMALMCGALPAGANQAQGKLDMGERVVGYNANLENKPNTPTKLFALRLDSGDLLRLYCVELNVNIDEAGRDLVLAEHGGAGQPAGQRGRPGTDRFFRDDAAAARWWAARRRCRHAAPAASPQRRLTAESQTSASTTRKWQPQPPSSHFRGKVR
jgi:hypothetical protein